MSRHSKNLPSREVIMVDHTEGNTHRHLAVVWWFVLRGEQVASRLPASAHEYVEFTGLLCSSSLLLIYKMGTRKCPRQ